MTHKLGTFCAALLHTHDVESAARFYGSVFGWQLERGAAGGEFMLRGQRVAAIEKSTNGADYWVPYVAVDDVVRAREAAQHAGGRIVETAEHERNTLAVIDDPHGARFGLCTADDPRVATLMDGAGAMWWIEVLTREPAVLQRYYAGLFQWHFTAKQLEPHPVYGTWMLADQPVGGLLPIGPGWDTTPRWQILFAVDDLERSMSEVVSAGGTIEVGPLEVPRAGTFTSVCDPHGALHVLAQPRSVASTTA
jgi:predicted enzyme related to lactoylglutathione lyase